MSCAVAHSQIIPTTSLVVCCLLSVVCCLLSVVCVHVVSHSLIVSITSHGTLCIYLSCANSLPRSVAKFMHVRPKEKTEKVDEAEADRAMNAETQIEEPPLL